jgi:hypothetical protein
MVSDLHPAKAGGLFSFVKFRRAGDLYLLQPVVCHLNGHGIRADAFNLAFQTPFAFSEEADGRERYNEQNNSKSVFKDICLQVLHGKSFLFQDETQ